MNQRKIQAVINRIEDDIRQYKNEIRYYNKNKSNFSKKEVFENVSHFEGRIDEAININRKLVFLKESIDK